MNPVRIARAVLICALLPFAVSAASLPGSMADESLVKSESLPRLSLGVAAEMLHRNVILDEQLDSELEGNSYYGYVGVDALRWLTFFGTIGATTLDSLQYVDNGGSYDSDLRWSLGLNASLWHTDLKEPEFMRGRLSIGFNTEYVNYSASRDGVEVDWHDLAFALPIGFEIPHDPMAFMGVSSLLLYAGPAYSTIDGESESGGQSRDLEQENEMGILTGLDVFAAPNVSVGGSMLYIDQASFTISARYHF